MIPRASVKLVVLLATGWLACGLGGCVTAHEAETTLEVSDFSNSEPLNDLYLLAIRCEGVESQGTWWVAQEEEASAMVHRGAEVLAVNSGEKLQQEGKVVVLFGPYTHGRAMGYEYWLFREGYQPDDFHHSHVEKSAKSGKTLKVSLERNLPGEKYSDEHVLDGIRKLADVADFLKNDSIPARDLMRLACEQLQKIIDASYRQRDINDAKELLAELEKRLTKFPALEAKLSAGMAKGK